MEITDGKGVEVVLNSLAAEAIPMGLACLAQFGRFIEIVEEAVGKKAEKIMEPMQPGDVHATYANIDALARDHGFAPTTKLEDGIPRFVKWYRDYTKT